MFLLLLIASLTVHGPVEGSAAGHLKTIAVPPGGYAFTVCEEDRSLEDFTVVTAPAPGPWPALVSRLPDSAETAIGLCGEWLQEDLRTRFADLLYCDLQVEGGEVPAFTDLDCDGVDEFILADSSGRPLKVLSTSDWSEHQGNCPSYVPVPDRDSILAELSYLELPDNSYYALGDMGSDGLEDLVGVTESGKVAVWNNRGTAEDPLFQPFYQSSLYVLPKSPGAFVSPALTVSEDGEILLFTGTCQNGFSLSASESCSDLRDLSWSVKADISIDTLLNICPTAVDSCGKTLFLCATRNGSLYRFSFDSAFLRPLDIPSVPGTYPDLAVALINDDEHPDLVAGTREGVTYYLPGGNEWFEGEWQQITGLPVIPSGTPEGFDSGLVFGSENGELKFFVPENDEWKDVTANSVFHGVNPGTYSSPSFADLNGDGTYEMVTGNSAGDLRLYSLNNSTCDGEPIYSELYSWSFQPSGAVAGIEDYYSRYFSPYTVLRIPEAEDAVSAYAREIINSPAELRDETAFSIAATPTDVLREMHTRNDVDLFALNASIIYEMAEELSYVRLIDSQHRTTCRLLTESGWYDVPNDLYYRFIVHPRILFETPAMVNAGFWRSGPDTSSMEMDEWLNWNPEDLYGSSNQHVFWRSFIPSDTSGGTSLAEIMSRASTCEDAVLRLCNFLSHSQPEGRMSFGYVTNDLQPMVIYEKAYGSCGEQSILQTVLCRTFFIPAYVVGCRGEDHQWAHYLDPRTDRWQHWDINYGLRGIGGVWVSGEGIDHTGKTISTVTAFGPENTVWPVTRKVAVTPGSGYMPGDSGYTATAEVTFTVRDSSGRSVPGALVLARSHWENANSVTEYDYTDSNGMCTMDLGWEPRGGYTVDVISPFGSTGSSSISFNEGHRYTVDYTLPYSMCSVQNVEIRDDDTENCLSSRERLYPPHYYSTSLYTVSSGSDSIEIESRDWTRWPERNTETRILFMDSANFSRYRSGFSCRALTSRFVPEQDDTCFAVIDNRNSLFMWKEFDLECNDLQEVDSCEAYRWLNAPLGERIHLRPEPEALPSPETDLNRSWITHFQGMEVVQDDPDDPLQASCILGPFAVDSDERSIELGTFSSSSGTDIDIFLFCDLNGNRRVDGMEEMTASSTSPTSTEIVNTTDIDTTSVYWLYVHGWKVPNDTAEVDIGMSFHPEWSFVYDMKPSGWVTGTPDTCSFLTNSQAVETDDIRLNIGELVIAPELQDDGWVFLYPKDIGIIEDVEVTNGEGIILDELTWRIDIDTCPPELNEPNMETDLSTMRVLIEVVCHDVCSGTAQVKAVLGDSITENLLVEEDSIWRREIDVADLSGRSVPLTVLAEDSAGNEIEKSYELDLPSRPSAIFASCYPMGTVYHHRPVIQTYLDLDGFEEMTGAEVVISNGPRSYREVLKPVVQEGNLLQFRPGQQLENGEYSALVRFWYGQEFFENTWTFSVESMSCGNDVE